MLIRVVVYVSEVVLVVVGDLLGLGSVKLDELVDDVVCFNWNVGVIGVLLFDGVCFLQYLEGFEDGLSVVYLWVFGVISYMGLIELQCGRVGNWCFLFWLMCWFLMQLVVLRCLVCVDWLGFVQYSDGQVDVEMVMDILVRLVEFYVIVV